VRTFQDLPCSGRPVRLRLTVRRFRCGTTDCPRRTFAEQVDGVTRPHGPRVQRLELTLDAFGIARAAAPRVLGVDDRAWRRGERYGAVLVDLEAGRPVDLLPERTSAALEQWLKEHPGVEVSVRDRSTEYARGATRGAPHAVQVVDRWQILKNARAVAERLLDRHAQEVRRTALPAAVAARHAAIRRLTAEGETILGIARRRGSTRTMVRRYRVADAPPGRADARRASALDPYDP